MTTIKMITTLTIAAATLLASCGATSTKSNDKASTAEVLEPATTIAIQYDFRIVNKYPHSTTSYTQGLQYVDGVMWEGTGREGKSHLQQIDLNTGTCDIVATLPKSEFGEGITHHKERIYQLTWEHERAHVYDISGKEIKSIRYKGEGWGITTDGERLFLSDGSSTIRRIDPETFETLESICVTLDGQPLDLINELEWVDGSIWANIYLTDAIVEIDPATGVVKGYVDLPRLRDMLEKNPEAEAFNGVAYNAESGHFYVTGKDWNRLFEIEIIK